MHVDRHVCVCVCVLCCSRGRGLLQSFYACVCVRMFSLPSSPPHALTSYHLSFTLPQCLYVYVVSFREASTTSPDFSQPAPCGEFVYVFAPL